MAEVILDLTDDQIDRLLSEAESRLAAQDTAVTLDKNKTVVASNPARNVSARSELAIEPTKPSKEQSSSLKELSVRKPELLRNKKKDVQDSAGEAWFNLPRTSNDPQTLRDLRILKFRGVLALGKQHFKNDTRKDPFPKYSQVGTLIEGSTDPRSSRLTRKERKRTLAEEVLGSGAALAKFKTKYGEIQERSKSGKKGHYKKLSARRKRQG